MNGVKVICIEPKSVVHSRYYLNGDICYSIAEVIFNGDTPSLRFKGSITSYSASRFELEKAYTITIKQ